MYTRSTNYNIIHTGFHGDKLVFNHKLLPVLLNVYYSKPALSNTGPVEHQVLGDVDIIQSGSGWEEKEKEDGSWLPQQDRMGVYK